MFRVYKKSIISKELFNVNLTKEEVETVLEGNLFLDHPEIDKTSCIVLEQENIIKNPTWTGAELREMTREEQIILLGETDLLLDGEWLEDGKIKKIEYDEELGYYRKVWNKELCIWEEGTTKEEFIEMRKNKILEYSKLEEDKSLLENSKFGTQEEIQLTIEKMQFLEQEINSIATNSLFKGE